MNSKEKKPGQANVRGVFASSSYFENYNLTGKIEPPNHYIFPAIQYVNTSTPPISTVEKPFICPHTDLMKLDHLPSPMMIFGQPFTGKTSLLVQLVIQATDFYGKKHWIRMLDLRETALNCATTGKWPTNIFELFSHQLKMSPKSLRELFQPVPNAKELLRKRKYEKLIKGELFLDGFDDIPIENREYFLRMLSHLRHTYNDCGVRVWISCRSYMKCQIIKLLGDESSFEILGYEVKEQKTLLFEYWKKMCSPKKIKTHEAQRLWEYTTAMHNEFCKEIKDFARTIGANPVLLEVIAHLLRKHVLRFFTDYQQRYRATLKAGPSGDGVKKTGKVETLSSTNKDSEASTGKKKNKKKKSSATNGDTKDPSPSTCEGGDGDKINDGVDASTTELMGKLQFMSLYVPDILENQVFNAFDYNCFKHQVLPENQRAMEPEYRRAIYLNAQYAIKTFPSYQYETLVPIYDGSNELVNNLTIQVDEELHQFGIMHMDDDGLIHFKHKLIGDYILAKHFSNDENMKGTDPQFDNFFLRVFLFDGEAKTARSYFDFILHHIPWYSQMLHDFLLKQYKLDPEDDEEWEEIRDDGTVWHLVVMERFHKIAVTMIKCFDPITEREQIRKLLKIRVPVEIYHGQRINTPTPIKIDGGGPSRRHLVSSLSLVAMFAHGPAMEELLKIFLMFFTPEELKEEFTKPDSWTPMHYAAMHSNLWFMMNVYNDVLIPRTAQPPPEMYNPHGQLPLHILLMSFSWCHIMVLNDCFNPDYDKHLVEGSSMVSYSRLFPARKYKNKKYAARVSSAVLSSDDEGEGEGPYLESISCREVISFTDLIKDFHGTANEAFRAVHHECIRLMVNIGGDDIDSAERTTGNRPLHFAVIDGCPETVSFILEKGASVDPKNMEWKTPLHYAGQYGHREIFKCLFTRGAKTTTKDINGWTPISMWERYGKKIDMAKNGPMSKSDVSFFRACADIEKIMIEQSARLKEQENEIKKKEAELAEAKTMTRVTFEFGQEATKLEVHDMKAKKTSIIMNEKEFESLSKKLGLHLLEENDGVPLEEAESDEQANNDSDDDEQRDVSEDDEQGHKQTEGDEEEL